MSGGKRETKEAEATLEAMLKALRRIAGCLETLERIALKEGGQIG